MSKSSQKKIAKRRLDAAMGNYNAMMGKSGTKGYNKPGSNKLKT